MIEYLKMKVRLRKGMDIQIDTPTNDNFVMINKLRNVVNKLNYKSKPETVVLNCTRNTEYGVYLTAQFSYTVEPR